MKQSEAIRIAIAESSAILRNGISAVLHHLPELHIQPIEVASPEALDRCLHGHRIDLLIVNPAFGGWFDLAAFRANPLAGGVKCLALPVVVADSSLLEPYDAVLSLYDEPEKLKETIIRLLHMKPEESEQEALSQREREIIVCVVKGMTNKEIAEKLYLSIHTVITHRRNIARKLQIHSPAGLTIYAIVNKLVELSDIKTDRL
ncbi:MAG: response regulator transcription factor [Bacteroidaceae bacterium]|jgi:DNA-binding NarL/FixJ family response regulator